MDAKRTDESDWNGQPVYSSKTVWKDTDTQHDSDLF